MNDESVFAGEVGRVDVAASDSVNAAASPSSTTKKVDEPQQPTATSRSDITPAPRKPNPPTSVSVSGAEIAGQCVPPGETLGRVLAVVLTRKAYRRYVYPAIAEMQAEYIEARELGHTKHAKWIAFRGHFLVLPGWIYALVGGWIVKKFIT